MSAADAIRKREEARKPKPAKAPKKAAKPVEPVVVDEIAEDEFSGEIPE